MNSSQEPNAMESIEKKKNKSQIQGVLPAPKSLSKDFSKTKDNGNSSTGFLTGKFKKNYLNTGNTY